LEGGEILYPIKSGFEKNSKFTTIKSPFLLWGKGFRDWGLEKPIYFEYKYLTPLTPPLKEGLGGLLSLPKYGQKNMIFLR
jgi:hypothetical protein